MRCAKCAAEIPDSVQFCPQCGQTIQSAGAAVQLDFKGTGLQLLGWILLAAVSILVVIPAAWVSAATGRWICRNLKFSDSTTAAFRGTGGQVVGWFILYIAVVIGYQVASFATAREGVGVTLFLLLIYFVLLAGIALKLMGWFVSNVELSSGPPLSFTGTYGGLLGWYLLTSVSMFTIVGWAWVTAAMYRWFARNARGAGIEFQFHGKGHQILWRTVVVILASLLIVPIPWIAVWLMRWMVQNVSLTRSAGASAPASA